MNHRLRSTAGLVVVALFCARAAFAGEEDCGSLTNAYGPYDWTNPEHRRDKIPIVTGAHFNMDVQTLKSGETSVSPLPDIDYTLRAIPNHHIALDTMMRYFLQGGQQGRYKSPECYFDRAMRFKPDDGDVYLLYAVYLHRRKKLNDAEGQYERAVDLMPDSADAHYNLGLLHMDQNRPGEAKKEAMQAYVLGYPLPGLKNRLKRAGAWSKDDEAALAKAIEAAQDEANQPKRPAQVAEPGTESGVEKR